jgi:iron(II)-dependent oxidoreductase
MPATVTEIINMMQDARARTLELVTDLNAEQLMGPKLPTVNPIQWEIGHVAYFYEFFVLRTFFGHTGVIGEKSDALYDSINVPHEVRWDLPLLDRNETLKYMTETNETLITALQTNDVSEDARFMAQFGVFHEDMHTEAFFWARQTLAYSSPKIANFIDRSSVTNLGDHPGFVSVPGGRFTIGAPTDTPFAFDNERPSHDVEVAPFQISKAPVTNAEFANFITENGYTNDRYWSVDGLKWRNESRAAHPLFWSPDENGKWCIRRFDQTIPLPAHEPVIHVCWYEAEAYAKWAGGRLPTECEWEVAALGERASDGTLAPTKRLYPWGDEPAGHTKANLDGYALGPVDVAAFPEGDSGFGCRQMLGNVWEWCADTFAPYSGFKPDAYEDYSQVLFGNTKVLRGGAWTTRSRMMHGTYRNYFEPHRRNIFAGFRLVLSEEKTVQGQKAVLFLWSKQRGEA